MSNKKGGCGTVGYSTVIVLFIGVFVIGGAINSISSTPSHESSVTSSAPIVETGESVVERSLPVTEADTEKTTIQNNTEPERSDVEIIDDETKNNEGKTGETERSSIVKGVTPEFKAQMDAYEAFFDEYIAFMNTYSSNSDEVDSSAMLNMLGKYTEFMTAMASSTAAFFITCTGVGV